MVHPPSEKFGGFVTFLILFIGFWQDQGLGPSSHLSHSSFVCP